MSCWLLSYSIFFLTTTFETWKKGVDQVKNGETNLLPVEAREGRGKHGLFCLSVCFYLHHKTSIKKYAWGPSQPSSYSTTCNRKLFSFPPSNSRVTGQTPSYHLSHIWTSLNVHMILKIYFAFTSVSSSLSVTWILLLKYQCLLSN